MINQLCREFCAFLPDFPVLGYIHINTNFWSFCFCAFSSSFIFFFFHLLDSFTFFIWKTNFFMNFKNDIIRTCDNCCFCDWLMSLSIMVSIWDHFLQMLEYSLFCFALLFSWTIFIHSGWPPSQSPPTHTLLYSLLLLWSYNNSHYCIILYFLHLTNIYFKRSCNFQ